MGLLTGIILWGFALIWFVVAVIMIIMAFPFAFNMGWWGFIFPIGKLQRYLCCAVDILTLTRHFYASHYFNWRGIRIPVL